MGSDHISCLPSALARIRDLTVGGLTRPSSCMTEALDATASSQGWRVGVGQSNAGVHFRDIGLRMEPIALLERPAKARRKLLRHGTLARPDTPMTTRTGGGARALQAMDAGRIRNEDRPGPADK
jgi:hypothetical protein